MSAELHPVERTFEIPVYSACDLAALELPQAAEPVSPHTRRSWSREALLNPKDSA